MTQQQFGRLGFLTRQQADLQARYFEAGGPEREAIAEKLDQVAAQIEALGDVVLGTSRPGRKLNRDYSFLTRRQRERRIAKEIPLGDQAARVTVVPRNGCLHGMQVG